MTLTITPTGATLGAIVTGVDLTNLDDAGWAAIEQAFLAHAVLIFPGQHLSEVAQIDFGRRFGVIEHLVAEREIVPISNQRTDGTVLKADEPGMQLLRGNEGWHTDSSYMPLAAKASVLSAHVVPSAGGQTEWADMRATYDALDEGTQARIAQLSAYHSLYYSQGRIGHQGVVGSSYGFHTNEPPLRPLVKVHPATGRKSLFIGRHAYGIPGLTPEESEKLLDSLVTFACQAPRTYSHAWQPGDVVIWDNRCVLHRARPFDYREARVMKHTRVSGDPVNIPSQIEQRFQSKASTHSKPSRAMIPREVEREFQRAPSSTQRVKLAIVLVSQLEGGDDGSSEDIRAQAQGSHTIRWRVGVKSASERRELSGRAVDRQ